MKMSSESIRDAPNRTSRARGVIPSHQRRMRTIAGRWNSPYGHGNEFLSWWSTCRKSNARGVVAERLAARPTRQFRRNQRVGPPPIGCEWRRCAGRAVPLAKIGRGALSATMVWVRRMRHPVIGRFYLFLNGAYLPNRYYT